jgi:hypothetical protein
MGGGVAAFDCDGDGDADLLFVNSGYWPWKRPANAPPSTPALYRNDGHGKFEDISATCGIDYSGYGMGVATGDYDNDGLVDVFISGVGDYRLYHNQGGGQFKDVTTAAGIRCAPTDWGTSATWIDIDNDGRLDLFVCNYLRWSKEIDFEADYQLAGIGRAYGQPWNFPGNFPYLFHNDGQGRFTDISESSGVRVTNRATGMPLAKSLGVAPVDLDGDGWMDLIVANDTVQNLVFHNDRNSRFREIGAVSGLAFDNFGGTRGAMGIDVGRFEADNSLGVSIGNFANEMTAFYVSRNNQLLFSDDAIGQGIGAATRNSLTFGVFFFDYDLDGWLDLLTANGHIEDFIERVNPAQRYRQPAQLFWNARGSSNQEGFLPVPASKAGPDLFRPIVGRGSAYADFDGDGDLDVVITQINGPPLLLRNDQKQGHDWLRLKLVGTRSNRDAIGAAVTLRTGKLTLWRQVIPTRGYLSQSELPLTFGLGDSHRVEEASIVWPDGTRQRLEAPALNRTLVVKQPE